MSRTCNLYVTKLLASFGIGASQCKRPFTQSKLYRRCVAIQFIMMRSL